MKSFLSTIFIGSTIAVAALLVACGHHEIR